MTLIIIKCNSKSVIHYSFWFLSLIFQYHQLKSMRQRCHVKHHVYTSMVKHVCKRTHNANVVMDSSKVQKCVKVRMIWILTIHTFLGIHKSILFVQFSNRYDFYDLKWFCFLGLIFFWCSISLASFSWAFFLLNEDIAICNFLF